MMETQYEVQNENNDYDYDYDYDYDGGYEIQDNFFTDILGGYEINCSNADEIINNILGGNESDEDINISNENESNENFNNYEYLYGGDSIQDNEQVSGGEYDSDISEEIAGGYIDFEIKYDNKLIGTQRNLVKVYETDLREIYDSRTFCVYEDIEKLKKMNLAKGGSLENAIVVKGDEVLNKEGLRNDKEFVNHKILDCIGDLFLSGYKIIGKIVCSQGGHKLTNQLLKKVFSDDKNFSIIEIKEKNIPHAFINRNFLKSIA